MYQFDGHGCIKRLSDGLTIPQDPGNRDYQQVLAWIGQGNAVAAAAGPSIEQLVVAAVQQRLDAFAVTRGYDDIGSAASYAGDENPRFNSDGTYAKAMRSRHWAACYEILAAVQAGQRAMPTVDDVLYEMPTLEWPT